MDVVSNAAYGNWNCPFFTNDATNILKHTFQILLTHNNARAFRVENNVGV